MVVEALHPSYHVSEIKLSRGAQGAGGEFAILSVASESVAGEGAALP